MKLEKEPVFDRSGGVPGGAPWERDWVETEENTLGRPRVQSPGIILKQPNLSPPQVPTLPREQQWIIRRDAPKLK